MTALDIHQFCYGSDNYGVLVHATDYGATACIDAGDANAAERALADTGWTLTHLLITHHHADHTAGLAALKKTTACEVIGPALSAAAIGGIDTTVTDHAHLEWAGRQVQVLHTPGHTSDMMNYYFPDDGLVFTGDTLFVLGCGRLFEGDADTMWASLGKLAALPRDTRMYCGHEYSQTNARFALSIDPDNAKLKQRAERIDELRESGKPTVPSTIGHELDENLFLRAGDETIRKHLGMQNATDAEVFAELRARKDAF